MGDVRATRTGLRPPEPGDGPAPPAVPGPTPRRAAAAALLLGSRGVREDGPRSRDPPGRADARTAHHASVRPRTWPDGPDRPLRTVAATCRLVGRLTHGRLTDAHD